MFDFLQHWQQKRRSKRAQWPAFALRYLEKWSEKPRLSDAWPPQRFVVFDTETTGLDVRHDRILSLGAVAVQRQEIALADTLELMLKVEGRVQTPETIAVHGIVSWENAQGMEEAEAMEAFLDFLGADVLVAHHLGFDTAMVERAVGRYAPGFKLYNLAIDTAHIAQRLDAPDKPHEHFIPTEYSLDALCQRNLLDTHDRHTAWGDAFLTAQLLLMFLHRLDAKNHHQLASMGFRG
jgi:DNA polymerase III subunit epsilon